MSSKKSEKKEKIIIIIKPLLLTFLPIIFKNYYDLWKDNKSISENIIPLTVFIISLLLDIIAIIYFSYYDFQIRDKDHKMQVKTYKEDIKKQNNTINENAILLKKNEEQKEIYEKTIAKKEDETKELTQKLDQLRSENEALKHDLILNSNNSKATAFTLIDEIVSGTADNLYQEIKRIKNDEHTEIMDWSMIETYCDKICKTLFDYITKIAKKGNLFSVSIIFKMKKGTKEGYFMPSRSYSDRHTPKMYRNFEPKEQYENYCFHTLFENASTKYKIYMNTEELKQDFENYKPDHSQYIGIPICCTGGKKIALIQVVAYRDSLISDSKESLKSLVTELFVPIANSVFLIDKIENSLQILSNIGASNIEPQNKKGFKNYLSGGHRAKK